MDFNIDNCNGYYRRRFLAVHPHYEVQTVFCSWTNGHILETVSHAQLMNNPQGLYRNFLRLAIVG